MASDESVVVLTGEHVPESDEPLSLRVVRLVAIAADRRTTAIEPLGRIIDTDALDALFAPARSDSDGPSVEVSFRYEGYRVEVDAERTVRLLDEPEQRD